MTSWREFRRRLAPAVLNAGLVFLLGAPAVLARPSPLVAGYEHAVPGVPEQSFSGAASVWMPIAGPGEPDDPQQPASDPESPGFIDPRLDQPLMPGNPTLADKGAQTWWGVCMACHGDAGQGLTDEWRQTAFDEDQNCWEAKCHGPRHPDNGFTFPRIVPPAWGPGTLKRFVNASELQAYLLASMPWWDPGSLTPDQSWEMTAFLLRGNGVLSDGTELDVESAGRTPVHLPIRSTDAERGWSMVWLGALALSAVGLISLRVLRLEMVAEPARPKRSNRASFFLHLHPATIPALQARWRYTLGAGGLAVFLSLVLLVTGILEMFVYIPTPEQAAESVQTITFVVPFGALVRGLHFWAAQALVAVAGLHLVRVIFTGAFTQPRRFNYLIGLALLVIVLCLDFTGYMLRWDEGIRWALVVGTNLLKTIPGLGEGLYRFVIGGPAPGAPTLIRFYAWHIFGLTLVMVVLIGWHIFRVRRDGGIAAPPTDQAAGVRPSYETPSPGQVFEPPTGGTTPPILRISRFDLVRREVLMMIIAGVFLGLVALLLPPPLAPSIQNSPTAVLADARAPWFFLWVQQLLRFGDAFWMGVAAPLSLLAFLIALPFIFPRLPAEQRGRWFPPAGRLVQSIVGLLLLVWLVLTLMEAL